MKALHAGPEQLSVHRALCELLGNSHAQAQRRHYYSSAGIVALDIALDVATPSHVLLSVRLSIRIMCTHTSVAEPGTDLQVGHGLRKAQGVKATVAGQRAIQPLGARGVGQPQRVACKPRHTMSAPLS